MDDEQVARELHQRWGPLAAVSASRFVPDPAVAAALLHKIMRAPRGAAAADDPEPEANDTGEVKPMPSVGDAVILSVTTIQRTNGAAWKGDRGEVIGKTGDGYKVRFGDFIADNVKNNEINKA